MDNAKINNPGEGSAGPGPGPGDWARPILGGTKAYLSTIFRALGGTLVEPRTNLTAYISRGQGNLDSDVNIAKLALALETDAAIACIEKSAKLKNPTLMMAGVAVGSVAAIHATRVRAAFNSLGLEMAIVLTAISGVENCAC